MNGTTSIYFTTLSNQKVSNLRINQGEINCVFDQTLYSNQFPSL